MSQFHNMVIFYFSLQKPLNDWTMARFSSFALAWGFPKQNANAKVGGAVANDIPCRARAPRIACPCRRAARRSGWAAGQAPPVDSPKRKLTYLVQYFPNNTTLSHDTCLPRYDIMVSNHASCLFCLWASISYRARFVLGWENFITSLLEVKRKSNQKAWAALVSAEMSYLAMFCVPLFLPLYQLLLPSACLCGR